jgi:RNA polymerase sigma-70 factor (ECF subfamily)
MFVFFESVNVSRSSQFLKGITSDLRLAKKEDGELLTISPKSASVSHILNSTPEEISEECLLAAAQKGDQAAYGEICKRHSQKILRITLRITRNYEDAEDALQESFLKAMVHMGEFKGKSQFSTWLTRIAINTALMKIRQNQKHRETPIQTTEDFDEGRELIELTDRSLNPEDTYSQREKAAILRKALGALRPRIREAIQVCHLQECSLKETSRKLGISIGATKGRLFQAKAALRKSSPLRQMGPARIQRAA